MSTRPLTTAVVGAGPAGLLFCILARLVARRRGLADAAWSIRLYDKREDYVRTHRLRLDPAPYRAIQQAVDDPRFDDLLAFLDAQRFMPEVNVLEDHLLALAAELGIRRERLEVGDGPGQTDLPGLRARLAAEGLLPDGATFTVVAADSVRSTVRERACGAVRPVRYTHQHVARLRITGGNLPAQLGVTDQYRLSKVLGSLIDYRLNRNGFAELDLFLPESEQPALTALHATPRAPIALDPETVRRLDAPLFRRVVEEVSLALGASELVLHSTFELEHSVMPRLVFARPDLGATVFLVGDAGVSLPFFRGMACLAACAHALAEAHCDALAGDVAAAAARYEADTAAIRKREMSVVRARARLIAGLREFARISALLPFPMQTWWLSVPDRDRSEDRVSTGFWLNALLAVAAAAFALGGSAASAAGHGWVASVGALAFPVQALGGVAYHAALHIERGPHRFVRRVWAAQIAALGVVGAAITALGSWSSGALAAPLGPVWWVALAVPFVVGLVAADRYGAGLEARARLGS